MGKRVRGKICFGVLVQEGAKMPWDSEEYDRDIDVWWGQVHSFQPSVDPWARGKPSHGSVYDAECHTYFTELDAWMQRHPLPVKPVNMGSSGDPRWVLAIPSSELRAEWGEPIVFDPDSLCVSQAELGALADFLGAHFLDFKELPTWFLGGYSD